MASRLAAGVHPDANCLGAYGEGGLGAAERAAIEGHLAECASCRQVVACAFGSQPAAWRLAPRARPATPRFARVPATWSAAVAVAAALWLTVAFWPRGPASLRPASAPAAIVVHPLKAAMLPAPPRVRRTPRRPAPAPVQLAATAAPLPPMPAIGVPVQPALDFSPLTTGFQDQVELTSVRRAAAAEVASWTGGAPAMGPNPGTALTVATSAVYNSTPVPPAVSEDAWASLPALANGFAGGPANVASPVGPLAPKSSTGFGWAIAHGGELLHSLGAGLWAAVPLVPGVHFRALFNSGPRVWAGGLASQLYCSFDAGQHWRQVQLPGIADPAPPLREILFQDARHGRVVAADGATWTTTDGGATWSK